MEEQADAVLIEAIALRRDRDAFVTLFNFNQQVPWVWRKVNGKGAMASVTLDPSDGSAVLLPQKFPARPVRITAQLSIVGGNPHGFDAV